MVLVIACEVIDVSKKMIESPSPNPLQTHEYICLRRHGCVLTGVGLGEGKVTPKPVATGGGGHWGPGDAREVGRLAACGPVGGRRWPPYSVPGRMAHGIRIGNAQVRGF